MTIPYASRGHARGRPRPRFRIAHTEHDQHFLRGLWRGGRLKPLGKARAVRKKQRTALTPCVDSLQAHLPSFSPPLETGVTPPPCVPATARRYPAGAARSHPGCPPSCVHLKGSQAVHRYSDHIGGLEFPGSYNLKFRAVLSATLN